MLSILRAVLNALVGNTDVSVQNDQDRAAREVILQMYDQVREYDIHYSNVRTTLSTFSLTAVFGLDAWIFSQTYEKTTAPDKFLIGAGILVPAVLLCLALFISAHFQRLTRACEKYQNELEKMLGQSLSGRNIPLFRTWVREKISKNRDEENKIEFCWFWSDRPQITLTAFLIIQILASSFYFLRWFCV
jgi:hypothetical protein